MNSFQKKMFLVSSRTLNVFHKIPAKNIFFLHIPKCGGTSLNNALQRCYLKWTLSDDSNIMNLDSSASWEAIELSQGSLIDSDTVDDHKVMKFREKLLLYQMSQNHINYISGHFPFSSKAHNIFSDKFNFVTVLRNPVDRWISSYFYNKNRQKSRYRKINLNINEYMSSDYGYSQGYEYAKFLGGNDVSGKFMTSNAVSKSKENLHKFNLVGFLEDMKSFKQHFEDTFGRKLQIANLNSKPNTEDLMALEIIEKSKDRIREICQPDIEIYDYARKVFMKKSDTHK